MILTSQLGLLVEAVTIFWLGRLLGPDALAVEAILRPITLIGLWLFLVAAGGASVLVARSVGAGDGRALSLIASAIGLTTVCWLAIAAAVLAVNGPLFDALATSQTSAAALKQFFLPWLLLNLPAMTFVTVLLMTTSAAGRSWLALVTITIHLAVSSVVVPLYIDDLGLGLAGPPLANASISFVLVLAVGWFVYRRRHRWSLGTALDRTAIIDRHRWKQFLDIGLPPQVARVAVFLSQVFLVQHVAADGPMATAGYGIAIVIYFGIAAATMSIGQAIGFLMAQRLGARDVAGARSAFVVGLVSVLATAIVIQLVLVGLGERVASAFSTNPDVVRLAARTMWIVGWSMCLIALSQTCLAVLSALAAVKRGGALSIIADLVGIGFTIAWVGHSRLEAAAWGIVVAQGVRALLLGTLCRWIVPARLRAEASS